MKHSVRIHELQNKVQSGLTLEQLESLSNEAILWIQEEACAEPGNRSKLGVLQQPKKRTEPTFFILLITDYFRIILSCILGCHND